MNEKPRIFRGFLCLDEGSAQSDSRMVSALVRSNP